MQKDSKFLIILLLLIGCISCNNQFLIENKIQGIQIKFKNLKYFQFKYENIYYDKERTLITLKSNAYDSIGFFNINLYQSILDYKFNQEEYGNYYDPEINREELLNQLNDPEHYTLIDIKVIKSKLGTWKLINILDNSADLFKIIGILEYENKLIYISGMGNKKLKLLYTKFEDLILSIQLCKIEKSNNNF